MPKHNQRQRNNMIEELQNWILKEKKNKQKEQLAINFMFHKYLTQETIFSAKG